MKLIKQVTLSLFLTVLLLPAATAQETASGNEKGTRTVIIDADTANEVDDLFAVVRGLIEPSWNVVALNAVQWQPSQWASQDTMEDSHRLNQLLLGHLDLPVPTKRGGHRRMYDWGDQAVHSAAAYEIIKQAKRHSPDNKLTLIALGALTNVASALFIEPSIAESIDLYWLGSTYDFATGVFRMADFNCQMDPQALYHVLNTKVQLSVIPVNVASAMTLDYQAMRQKLDLNLPLNRFLVSRWDNHIDGGRQSRTIWDLGLITAIIKPELAKTQPVQLSPDFGHKHVTFYQHIDAAAIWDEFFTTLKQHQSRL